MEFFKKYKDYLYYYFAEKNWGVRREYGPYVDTHQEEHLTKRWKHWWMLFRLNWHYRILRKDSFLYLKTSKKTASANAQRLPYLGGAESEISKRGLSVHLAMRMLPYDVISFDIFDTLLLRSFDKPISLFYLVGQRLNIPEFAKIRIDAEKTAHEIAVAMTGNREINIEDIYNVIEKKIGLPKQVGIQTELQIELEHCFANPYMKQVYDMMIEQQKKVIFVSDMYLPEQMMVQLLHDNGYVAYEKIYISCEYRASKHSKGLFKYVLKDYPNCKIVHVGDNYNSDKVCADACGITGIHYKNVNAIGNLYRAEGMSRLIGSLYRGIINSQLHNGIKKFDIYYEYGFVYGGIYVLGFCNWIYKKALQEGVEKVLFLSRDGAIYQKVFETLFNDVKSEYFLWSRFANSKYTFFYRGPLAFQNVLENKMLSTKPYTLGQFLDEFDMSVIKDKLYNYDLSENILVIPENYEKISRILVEERETILNEYNSQMDYIKDYIKNKIGSSKKVAIVDVGWVGNGPMGIKNIIQKEINNECDVKCWVTGAISSKNSCISTQLLSGIVESYMFSEINNINFLSNFVKKNNGKNHEYFEMLAQDVIPSYSGITKEGQFCFLKSEVESNNFITRIQKGIYDFSLMYYKFAKNDKYLLNISGTDAFAPFNFAIRSNKFFINNFSGYKFGRNISSVSDERVNNKK